MIDVSFDGTLLVESDVELSIEFEESDYELSLSVMFRVSYVGLRS